MTNVSSQRAIDPNRVKSQGQSRKSCPTPIIEIEIQFSTSLPPGVCETKRSKTYREVQAEAEKQEEAQERSNGEERTGTREVV